MKHWEAKCMEKQKKDPKQNHSFYNCEMCILWALKDSSVGIWTKKLKAEKVQVREQL